MDTFRIKNTLSQNQLSEGGYTLIIILIIMVCASIAIATGLSVMQSTTLSSGTTQIERTIAIAEAGLEAAIARIESDLNDEDNTDWSQPFGTYDPSETLTGTLAGGNFTVTYTNFDKHHITLQSKGEYHDCVRTVTRGITRIAKGGNFVVFCQNTGGFGARMASGVKGGNVYSNANINFGPGGPTLLGRVYKKSGVTVSGVTPLEGQEIIASPYRVIDDTYVQLYRDKRQELNQITVGNCTPASPLAGWPGAVVTLPSDLCCSGIQWGCCGPGWLYFNQPNEATLTMKPDYTLGGAMHWGVTDNSNINFTFEGSFTISGGASFEIGRNCTVTINVGGNLYILGNTILQIGEGSLIKIICHGNMTMSNVARLVANTSNTTYLFVGGKLLMDLQSQLESPSLRVLVTDFENKGDPRLSRFPGTGELTFYLNGGTFDLQTTTKAFTLCANIILDHGAELKAGLASHLWGVVYCFDDSQVIFEPKDGDSRGTCARVESVISNNLTRDCLYTRFDSGPMQSPDYWREPAGFMPTMAWYNPMGTGGYGGWDEIQ